MALTAAEIQAHPEYPHGFWALEPTQKGKLDVAQNRGGPIGISYEVHGDGPTKIVFIMGLGSIKEAWQRQTKDFGHTHDSSYSVLVLDNRGMGASDKPLMRYSTSEMALDVLEIIDHISWTGERALNIVGISMGGMIAQELAYMIPTRLNSLCLVSTAPRLVNTVGFVENLRNRINLLIPRSLDAQMDNTRHNIYTSEWLAAPDDCEYVKQPFPTNADRFAAGEVYKRTHPGIFDRKGFLSQVLAAGWHHKSKVQIEEIGDKVGRERICVVHGTEDKMITFYHGEMLLRDLGGEERGVTKSFWQGQGHAIPAEKRKDFFEIVASLCRKGEELNGKA